MKKVMGLVIGLVPVSAFGECVPVPDCASIGYTETSCEGDGLKCPFDTTKLKCIPCDSSYKYTCIGENIKNPIGDTCNDKYAACSCIAGATFINGECVCDTSCVTIGNIYYSDGTCSSCNLTDKTPVGIVAYKTENKSIIISLEQSYIQWSMDQKDANGDVLVEQNYDIPSLNNAISAISDYNGFDNTRIIVEAYGENAEGVAAVYCYNYVPLGLENTKKQWYLPAAGELYKVLTQNFNIINTTRNYLGLSNLISGYYWSSSEYNAQYSYLVTSGTGNTFANLKKYERNISCFLEI